MSLSLSLGLLELRKKKEVLYGATAVSALLGLTVARMRRRKSMLRSRLCPDSIPRAQS